MRPLRVEFTSYLDREAFVRNGYHLAKSEEFRAVGVSRDLIKEDRIASRNNYLMKKQPNQQNEAHTVGCFFCPQYLLICLKPSHIRWESHSSMYAKFGEDRIRITYGRVLYKLELIIMTLLCVHQIINGLDLVAVIRVRSGGLLFTGRHFKPLQLLHQ